MADKFGAFVRARREEKEIGLREMGLTGDQVHRCLDAPVQAATVGIDVDDVQDDRKCDGMARGRSPDATPALRRPQPGGHTGGPQVVLLAN